MMFQLICISAEYFGDRFRMFFHNRYSKETTPAIEIRGGWAVWMYRLTSPLHNIIEVPRNHIWSHWTTLSDSIRCGAPLPINYLKCAVWTGRAILFRLMLM